VVEAVQSPNTVRVRTADRVVTVDLTALGGVTVAVAPGEKIAAVGTMEQSGQTSSRDPAGIAGPPLNC
jgi:hypothetical protein